MSDNSPIGILDSGVGGLTAADCVFTSLPNESIIYFGDAANMPYGNRTPEEIVFLANRMIHFLEEQNVKVILLDCNTISSMKEQLKSRVPLIDIVTAGASAVGREAHEGETVGLIATKATVESGAYVKAIAHLSKRITVRSNASTSLPKIIDSQLENASLLDEKIRECIDPIVEDRTIRKLILGCSHFPIIREEISLIYPFLELIDPAVEQTHMLSEYLTKRHAFSEETHRKVLLCTSGEKTEFDATLQRLQIKPDEVENIEW